MAVRIEEAELERLKQSEALLGQAVTVMRDVQGEIATIKGLELSRGLLKGFLSATNAVRASWPKVAVASEGMLEDIETPAAAGNA